MSNPQVCLKAVQSARGCAGNVPCVRESIESVRTSRKWYGGCGNAPECAGVPQDRECGGKWKALESSKSGISGVSRILGISADSQGQQVVAVEGRWL